MDFIDFCLEVVSDIDQAVQENSVHFEKKHNFYLKNWKFYKYNLSRLVST